MKPDSIQAIGMITMAFFTAGAIFVFRTKPIKDVAWRTRVPAAFGASLITLIIISIQGPRCVELPAPFGRFYLTALSISLIVIFVKREMVIAICLMTLLLSGAKLEKHFHETVHFTPGFTTIDANTHKPMAKGCNDMNQTEGIAVEKLWHTWFTGVYIMKI